MIPLLGKVLNDRYRVEEHIGRGGMAEVYRAFDLQRGVYLALKVLRDDLAEDKIFLRRFEREARTLAALQHPNIVRFYGFERSNGYVYMLMDFIHGKTLRKMIAERDRPFTEQEVIDILDPVCRALHYAHQAGRVHCDVKSANIMVQDDGHVYLTDFGIARGMDAATSTMVGIGTPAYMAPELIRGEDPSPQTDIYALGIVVYEMLTEGERPFTGERATITGTTAEKVRWEHLKLEQIPMKTFNAKVHVKFEQIVGQCLNKTVQGRYATTMDLLDELNDVVNISNKPKESREHKPDLGKEEKSVEAIENKPFVEPPGNRRWGYGIIGMLALGLVIFLGFQSASQPTNEETVPTIEERVQSTIAPTVVLKNTSTPEATATPEIHVVASQISGKDGMTLVYVPAGEFMMGTNIQFTSFDFENVKPKHKVYLDAYWIDQTEVTNAQYQMCVQAGECNLSNDPYEIDDYNNPEFYNHPVVGVNWSNARDYCQWAGRQLPTEAQWEKAARGTDQRTYPWGEGLDCSLANYRGCTEFIRTSPVGFYPVGASPYGALDMAGNVFEWVADWYDETYYARSPYENPTGPKNGYDRGLRGGAWYSAGFHDLYSWVRTWNRFYFNPDNKGINIGFRCALPDDA